MACLVPNGTLLQPVGVYREQNFVNAAQEAAHSLDVGALFQAFSILDSTQQDIKYCHLWDRLCQNPWHIFENLPLLTVCSLYSNITQQITDGRLGSNWTAAGFSWQNTATIQTTRNVIPTCLISYCALIPECSSRSTCLVNSFYTSSDILSGQGVADCLQDICEHFQPHVNLDFGGIGV